MVRLRAKLTIKSLVLFLVLFCGAFVIWEQRFRPTPPVRPFQDKDVVCFLGDSITQSGGFQATVMAFYLTRYPEKKVWFRNCGIAGDTADGAVRRLKWDVFPRNPTVVSLMFGMNDIRRNLYGSDASPTAIKEREQALEDFQGNLANAVKGILQKKNVEVVLMAPSPYDEFVDKQISTIGLDGALRRCGIIMDRLAHRYHVGLIDFHDRMAQLVQMQRSAEDRAPLILPDRIHPTDIGQFVLGYLYLRAQGVSPLVSEVHINGETGLVRATNAAVTDFVRSSDGLSFVTAETALPFPVSTWSKAASNQLGFGPDLSEEILKIEKLKKLKYEVRIDDELVGTYSATELGKGINIGFVENTPQQRQAQRVFQGILVCRDIEGKLRRIAQVRKMLNDAHVLDEGSVQANRFLQDYIDKVGPEKRSYYEELFSDFHSMSPKVAQLEAELTKATNALWTLNRPSIHRYKLVAADVEVQ